LRLRIISIMFMFVANLGEGLRLTSLLLCSVEVGDYEVGYRYQVSMSKHGLQWFKLGKGNLAATYIQCKLIKDVTHTVKPATRR
jgi:hypothetical protein